MGCLVLFPLNMTHFHQPRSCKVELPAKYPSKSLEVQSWALTTEVLEIPRLGSPIIVRHVFQWCWTSILNELVHLISSRIHLLPLHPNTSDTTPGGLMDMFQPPLCLGPSSIHLRVCNFILRSAELVSKLVILFPWVLKFCKPCGRKYSHTEYCSHDSSRRVWLVEWMRHKHLSRADSQQFCPQPGF